MHIAQNWRIRQARYALQGVRCENCGTILFPARAVCPHCQAPAVQLPRSENNSGEARNHDAFTVVSDNGAQHLSQAAR